MASNSGVDDDQPWAPKNADVRRVALSLTHPAHHSQGERWGLHFGGNPGSLLREVREDQVRWRVCWWCSLPCSASVAVAVAVAALARSWCSSRWYSRVPFPAIVGAGSSPMTLAMMPGGLPVSRATLQLVRQPRKDLALGSARIHPPRMGRTEVAECATRRERVARRSGWKLQLQVVARCWLNLRADRICPLLSLSLSLPRSRFLSTYPTPLSLPAAVAAPSRRALSRFQHTHASSLTRANERTRASHPIPLEIFLPFRVAFILYVRSSESPSGEGRGRSGKSWGTSIRIPTR